MSGYPNDIRRIANGIAHAYLQKELSIDLAKAITKAITEERQKKLQYRPHVSRNDQVRRRSISKDDFPGCRGSYLERASMSQLKLTFVRADLAWRRNGVHRNSTSLYRARML